MSRLKNIQNYLQRLSLPTLQRALKRKRELAEHQNVDTNSTSSTASDLELSDDNSFHSENGSHGVSDAEETSHSPTRSNNQDEEQLDETMSDVASGVSHDSENSVGGENATINAHYISDLSSDELSDDDSSDFGPENNGYTDEPLYHNSNIHTGEYVVLILELYLKNKLSKSCLNDILQLINCAIPQPNRLPKTKFQLFKFLEVFVGDFKIHRHRYCENKLCLAYIGEWEETKETVECDSCKGKKIDGMFVENFLPSIIKHCFEQRQVYKNFVQVNMEGDVVSDICNGKCYKKINFARTQYDVTLLWNTDGIPVFKSSNAQLWPILFTIAELKPKKRRDNVIMAGLWFGSHKPKMNTFIRPFVDSLRTINDDGGIRWKHPENGVNYVSKVTAPILSVDSAARAPLQNISQWNGAYGCFRCEHEGEGWPVRVYPFKADGSRLRTDQRMRRDATKANPKNRINGVIGPAYVSLIPTFDMTLSFIPDYMHSVLLGVTRQFLFLWLDSSNHNKPWYIGNKVSELDKTLLSIKPPNDLSRLPRSLTKRLKYKASEFRNWLLFYSLLCIKNVLPSKYVGHWLCLVGGIFILLKQNISKTDLLLASNLLTSFVIRVKALYGESQYKYNVHLLLHLTESVKNWGPLWANACFNFENSNGMLLRLIHGTQQVSEQLVNSNKVVMAYEVLKNEIKIDQERVVQAQFQDGINLMSATPISANIIMPQTIKNCITQFQIENEDEVLEIYSKIQIKHLGSVTSNSYKREIKRKSSFVAYDYSLCGEYGLKFGQIECFVKYRDKGLYCIIQQLKMSEDHEFRDEESGYFVNHMRKVVAKSSLAHIKPDVLHQKVIKVKDYLIVQPNYVEKNL